MEIILQAFGGKLRSAPITLPATAANKTSVELIQPRNRIETATSPYQRPLIHAEFVWTGRFTTVDNEPVPLFELANVWKEWEV